MTPLDPSEPVARKWLADELAKAEYAGAKPTLWERFWAWMDNVLGGAGEVPVPLVVLGIVLVVVAVVVIVLIAAGPTRFAGRVSNVRGALFEGGVLTAAEHRALAAEHAAAGRWEDAVQEAFRGLVRDLVDRTIVDDRPGLTADEATWEASGRLPGQGEALLASAEVFDAVSFGGQSADRPDYDTLVRLDAQVRATRPTAHTATTPALAAPR